MEKDTGLKVLAMLAIVSLVLSCGLVAYAINQPSKVTEKIVTVDKPVVSEYNDTAITAEIAKIQSTLDKDDLWKANAQKLAEAEYTNRHIYNALIDLNVTDLDNKDDISKYVIRDTDVTGADADDKDANVSQKIRVYYENSMGDHVRITLDVDTEIVENEVENTVYSLA